jgi:hypothetical protein
MTGRVLTGPFLRSAAASRIDCLAVLESADWPDSKRMLSKRILGSLFGMGDGDGGGDGDGAAQPLASAARLMAAMIVLVAECMLETSLAVFESGMLPSFR